jgi:hypothetical protein
VHAGDNAIGYLLDAPIDSGFDNADDLARRLCEIRIKPEAAGVDCPIEHP